MFKQLLSDNRIFVGLVCLLVFIAAGLLYLNRVKSQARRDIQRTQEIVEQLQTPTTERQTTTGGHYHPDGTYHPEPHEAHTSPATTTPTNPQTGTTGSTPPGDIASRMWTGKPLRETSSPGSLSPEERKALDAEIQRLQAEYTALERRTEPLVIQSLKLSEENLFTLSAKQDAVMAEQRAVRANASLSAAEKERLLAALDNQFDELMAVKKANREKSQALREEAKRLYEKMKVLREQIEVLRAQGRKTDD